MGVENTTIGNYHVLSIIAYGSFGRVYLARHNVLANRTVALKLMHTVPLSSTEEHQQFLHEAKILELLQHPFILPILDVGIHDGMPYIVSEYAEGGSLRQYLKEHQGQLCELEEALAILSQIAQGLQHAHQQNIIHRDIKPENILFNGKKEALLADFGLATMLATASVKYVTNAGTPRYMAPEQFQGQISKETDQYALGCIAYELLTGHAPFDGIEPIALMYQHVHVTPQSLIQYNPQLPPSIDQAILKALSKQRQDRHTDVEAFMAALSTSTQPLASTPPATQVVMSSAMQEAASPTSNSSDATLPPTKIAEDNIPISPHAPSANHVQRGDEPQGTTIVPANLPAISPIASNNHSRLSSRPERTQIDKFGFLMPRITGSTRRVAVAALVLILVVVVVSSSLWTWQNAHSAKTQAPLQPTNTAMPTLTTIASPTTASTPTRITDVKPIPPTPTPTPIPPTPTPAPVPLKLVASSTAIPSSSSQCTYVSSEASYICPITLSTSSGNPGAIHWSSSYAVQGCYTTCEPTSIGISPSSGTLNAGDTVHVSISSQGDCYHPSKKGSITFSGPANAVTISYNCDIN
ncbi:hypothetical protein KSF_051620 [Reticulibacter mediterranei]|uniref:non-specific serine/threonine protein kinase n=1 Tax=Reticulibacter mediterranei TaxID=2778369 RepID=A0A8J3IGM0_9CHLR|nr:serine/threonine-protein kinase [Reticulibacter mediterranei]GHO95114.1 hypothetical protein KSF_051620 [Reticulibacter mediterranei]